VEAQKAAAATFSLSLKFIAEKKRNFLSGKNPKNTSKVFLSSKEISAFP